MIHSLNVNNWHRQWQPTMNADINNWHLTTIDSCQQLTLFNLMKYIQRLYNIMQIFSIKLYFVFSMLTMTIEPWTLTNQWIRRNSVVTTCPALSQTSWPLKLSFYTLHTLLPHSTLIHTTTRKYTLPHTTTTLQHTTLFVAHAILHIAKLHITHYTLGCL